MVNLIFVIKFKLYYKAVISIVRLAARLIVISSIILGVLALIISIVFIVFLIFLTFLKFLELLIFLLEAMVDLQFKPHVVLILIFIILLSY